MHSVAVRTSIYVYVSVYVYIIYVFSFCLNVHEAMYICLYLRSQTAYMYVRMYVRM